MSSEVPRAHRSRLAVKDARARRHRPVSTSKLLEIEEHARAALDALLAFAGALERDEPMRARTELEELRAALTATEAARGRAFPVLPPVPAHRGAALGAMLTALASQDPLTMARALARLELLVAETSSSAR